MKKRGFKKVLLSALSLAMMFPTFTPVFANEPVDWKSKIKDHWDFETSETSIEGEKTTGTLNGITREDTGSEVFNKALKFGAGADKYMRLENYINTGNGQTSFSMWYQYDTSITDTPANAPAILLQHEGAGKTILQLKDGKYDTFLNGQNVASNKGINKGKWEHITVVFNQDTKKVKYYINGVLDSEKNLGNTVTNQKLSLRVGAHKTAGSTDPHPMRGFIDELYVFNDALTDAEAKDLYEQKASQLEINELKKLIGDVDKELASVTLPAGHDLLVKLEAAKGILDSTSVDEIKVKKAELQAAFDAYKATKPISIAIDSKKITQEIDADSIFGINHRFAFNGYGTFDSKTMKVKDDFKKLYEDAGFGSIRYPGGTISNLFNWKTTLGPKEKRVNQIHGFYNTTNNGKDQGGIVPNFGLGEIATFADEVGSEIVYVYSLGRGSVQDAEDLVEYLNAQVGTNPNGGIDWAAVRARNGHEEPYNVRYFEIGNEMQQGGQAGDGTESQAYWTAYVQNENQNGFIGTQDAYIDGGFAYFDKKYTVKEDDWHKTASQSDGSANQVRYLRYANINPGTLDEDGNIIADPNFKAMEEGVRVFAGTDGNVVEWRVVDDLSQYGPEERVCVVDYTTGAIKFGDGVHGRIPKKGNNIYATYKVKRQGFIDISRAIKETTAAINEKEGSKHEANVYTSYEDHAFFEKMKNRNAEKDYDGMTIHPYSDPVSGADNTEAFYDNAMHRAEVAGIGKVTSLTSVMPEGKVPVISEYGIFRNTQSQVRSQTHAIYIAKVLMEYVRLGSPYIQKHCLSDWYSEGADTLGPTQQAVIQVVEGKGADRNTGEGEYTFFSTPSAHVFKMLNSGFGDHIIETTLSDVPHMENGVTSLSTLASKDDDGNLYVAIVNVDREHNREITLNVNEDLKGRTMTIQKLETDSFTDANTKENPNAVNVKEEAAKVLDGNPTITVNKHSFVMVKIAPEVKKADLENVMNEVDALNASFYANFDDVLVAYRNARAILNNPKATAQEIKAAYDALNQAIKALQLKDADYSKVDEAIKKAEQLNKEDYVDFTGVEKALQAVIRGKKIDEQASVDAMATQIEQAIAKLEKRPATPSPEQQEGNQDNQENQGSQDNQDNQDNQGTVDNTPSTSDNTNVMLFVSCAMIAGIGLLMVSKKKKSLN